MATAAGVPFACEYFAGQTETGQAATQSLLHDVLPLLRDVGAYDRQTCYFDRLRTEQVERIRLCFTDHGAGALVYDRLKGVRARAGLPAPFRVQYSPASMLSGLVVGPKAGALFDGFSCRTAKLLFEWMEASEAGRQGLLTTAFDLLSIQILRRTLANDAATEVKAYPQAFLTYRSHADGFFLLSTDAAKARARMEGRYRTIADWARGRLLELTRMVADDRLPDALERWGAEMTRLLQDSVRLIERGEIGFAAGQGYIGDDTNLSESRFHQTIQASRGFQWFMRSNPRFLATRLATGLLYLSLRRMGLPLLERYFLCHSIARTVEELYELDAVNEMREFVVSVLTPHRFRRLARPLIGFLVRLGPGLGSRLG